MLRAVVAATAALGFVALCGVYLLYPANGNEMLFGAQFQLFRAFFVAAALVLGGHVATSWMNTWRDSVKQKQRVERMDKTLEQMRRKRLELQEEASLRARLAKAEEEAKRRAAAEEAASRASAARALEASQHQPGAGQVHVSEVAMAAARERQQELAAKEQEKYLEGVRRKEEEARRVAVERARELLGEKAMRQPGGGVVHASDESLAAVRTRQQRGMETRGKGDMEEEGEREEEERGRERAPGAASSAPSGAKTETRAGSASAGTRSAAGTTSARGGRSGLGGTPGSSRAWDGPIFPGDELKGWVSPASEEASRIRAQQDAALSESLRRDRAREEEKLRMERAEKEKEEKRRKLKEAKEERQAILLSLLPREPSPGDADRVCIAVRLPDSSLLKRHWRAQATVQDLYNWVESLALMTLKDFQLVKPFPRDVLERSKASEATLADMNLCPQALLVAELLSP